MPDIHSQRDPVEVLADEYMSRQRRGECPTIEEYALRYPDLAEEIRELFPTIAALEKLKVRQQRSPDGRVSLAGCQLERLGDFRVIREIGRGGMGVVYEAEQESLGRRVAVKVLPKQALLDPKHLQRFQREARTAAGLHHTNIVPVFGVGQHEGFYYYVMQYIPGVGLDRVLARLEHEPPVASESGLMRVVQELLEEPSRPSHTTAASSEKAAATQPDARQAALRPTSPVRGQVTLTEGSLPPARPDFPLPDRASTDTRYTSHWAGIAQLGLQVADALHYAHSQGTLHRDIKPANLIIDTQGIVWVADFGLAKALEQDEVSRPGDIVGTLAYMAPEQLRGQADRRSDVYSLGLTLYELLTLQPAFRDTDRTRLLQRIAHEDPVRPRQVRPEIPQELETIVLKATAREPERRYQTAAELAADLQCFLEDRPIRARRTTPAERLWRWCRRNRAVASLSALAVTLLFVVAVVASLGYARTSRALAGEKAQRQRAESATDVAVKVLDRLYERFTPKDAESAKDTSGQASDGEPSAAPVLSEGAAAVLEDMLTFYDRLAEQGGSDAGYREKVAMANRRVGDIRQHLGQLEPAAAAYQRALDIYQQLDQSAGHESHLSECAKVLNQLGSVYRQSQKFDLSREAHQRALQLLQEATKTTPAPSSRDYELARTWYLLARCELADRPPRDLADSEGGRARLPYEGFYEDSGPHPPPDRPDSRTDVPVTRRGRLNRIPSRPGARSLRTATGRRGARPNSNRRRTLLQIGSPVRNLLDPMPPVSQRKPIVRIPTDCASTCRAPLTCWPKRTARPRRRNIGCCWLAATANWPSVRCRSTPTARWTLRRGRIASFSSWPPRTLTIRNTAANGSGSTASSP